MSSGEAASPRTSTWSIPGPRADQPVELAQMLRTKVEVAREHARKPGRDAVDERLRAHDLAAGTCG